jgi:hypothetical protein
LSDIENAPVFSHRDQGDFAETASSHIPDFFAPSL